MYNVEESSDKPDDHDVIYALRTIHQSQTQLVILADQKANILIGVVAIIFTIIFTKSTLLNNLDSKAFISFIVFLVLEASAILLALLVILPKNIHHHNSMILEDIPNPLFFGAFTHYTQKEYVDFLTSKMNSNHSARSLLATDLYQVGTVLKKKYLLLKYAYSFAVAGVLSLFVLLFN